jgi:hypothetical protein
MSDDYKKSPDSDSTLEPVLSEEEKQK